MSMRWRKVLGDLRVHWRQIGAMLLVLIAGAAGVGAALNAQAVLKREIAASYAQAESPDLALWFDTVTPAAEVTAAGMEGVAQVDVRRVITTRIAVKDGSWLLLRLAIVRDFASLRTGRVHHHGDQWPPLDRAILIEQSGMALIGAAAGDMVQIRSTTGESVSVPLAGVVHDPAVAPSTQERMIYAYATPQTAALLGAGTAFDQLLVKLAYRGSSADAGEQGARLQALLAAQGNAPLRLEVLPAAHPHAALMGAMLKVLGVFSAMAFACSAALAGFMASAWMRREVRQVGIMKTLGARSSQIAIQYLALAGPAIALAVAVALPLGTLLGRIIIDYYAVSLNIDIGSAGIPPALLWQEIALAVSLPLLAVAIPIARAARMTAYRAIHDAGIVPLSTNRLLTRLIRVPGRVRWSLAMRNSWRRPWRLMIMLLGLTAGGALLLMTHSNYESLIKVIDASLANQGHDIEVQMPRASPAAELESIARGAPGVAIAEGWRRAGVSAGLAAGADGDESAPGTRRVALTAYPPDSQLFRMRVVQGRRPAPDARDEIIITRALLDAYPHLQIGKTVDLQFRERRQPVRVVGLVEEIGMPLMYTTFQTFEAVTGLGDSSSLIRVKVADERIDAVVSALDRALLSARKPPAQIFSRDLLRDSLDEHFKVVGDVIRMVALGAALIGAIMLAATGTLNVLERGREIGILRTLGATPRDVVALFWAEGASVTLLALLLATALSIPLTLLLLEAAEKRLLHMAVPLHFSLQGFAILCGGMLIVLAAIHIAVMLGMRRAVRETLAYE